MAQQMPQRRRSGPPNLAGLRQYSVNRGGAKEAIRQPLYDYQAYDAAGQSSLTFFQIPKGQAGKTINDTNMVQAGTLPNPQEFLIQTIQLVFFPGVNPATESVADPALAAEFINDVYALAKGGELNLTIGSKPYLDMAPLGAFPPAQKLDVSAALALSTSTAANALQVGYAQLAGPVFKIEPLLLEATQNFSVVLSWPTAVPMPSGQNARIGVVLDGTLYRSIQ